MVIDDKECEEKWRKDIEFREKNHKALITIWLQTHIALGYEQA
jgi:hypothetical protein